MSGIPPQTQPQLQSLGGPGGPPPALFLAALQGILQAINAQSTILGDVAAAATGGLLAQIQIALLPAAPPAAPSAGSVIYVSNVDGHTYVVNSAGTRTQIAP